MMGKFAGDFSRTVATVDSVLTTLHNNSRGNNDVTAVGWNDCFTRGLDPTRATSYADGWLRVGLAIEIAFGTLKEVITPIGCLTIDRIGTIDSHSIATGLNALQCRLGASFTNSSTRPNTPFGETEYQLMILNRDPDGAPLADFPGVIEVQGHFPYRGAKLAEAPAALLFGDAAVTQVATLLDYLPQLDGNALKKHATSLLIREVERQTARPLTSNHAMFYKTFALP
jgi:hypothetical protein